MLNQIVELPFIFDAQVNPDNGKYPATLPFELDYDPKIKLIQQKKSEEVSTHLNAVYKSGQMLCGSMVSHESNMQGESAVELIKEIFPDLSGKRVLEIGCGIGFVLCRLNSLGAKCTGLEPGKQIWQINKPDIELINDFFPSSKIKGAFDVIMHFNVLEHLENPLHCLGEQVKYLQPGGFLIFGVPNCEPYLPSGDISMLAHEHYSYFTRESIACIAQELGLYIHKIFLGAKNSMIFCALSPLPATLPQATLPHFDIEEYNRNILLNEKILKDYFKTKLPAAIAVYCPLRALNILFRLQLQECRLLDDNPELTGKFLPGMNKPIENLTQIKANPPQHILIFSRTFGREIFLKCSRCIELQNTTLTQIADLDG